MDKQSSSVNQWTKGSNNDSKATQKPDFNSKAASNNNSFEFLDMSSCDETQKLKLKNTLSSPSSFSTQRDRYRSNFATRNSSIKPTPQQYSTIQYHANSNAKNQKTNYQFYPTKHLEPDMMMRHVSISSRSFSSDANNFSSKNNSNFNNSLNNTTNVSSKRLDDNRHYPNTQDKLNKWHSTNKKPPYVGLKEPTQVNQREAPASKRPGGPKDSLHYHQLSKDLPRDSNKNFSNSQNMSPPMTNTTTSTTMTISNQSNVSVSHQPHYNSQQQLQYGSTPMHPQMFPSGTVPLISHYPMHTSFMAAAPPGQQMIASSYNQHNDRHDMQNDHQSIPPAQHMMNSTRGSGRRGRGSRNSNNMGRRDYQMRQSNQNQQSSDASNEYQSLMEPPQGAVINAPYQQIYFHPYPTYYGGPNGAGPHLAALPGSASAPNAQNLTGQPLFALQQPLAVYGYNPHHYPIMYNMMPQGHPMSHQQSDMDNEHNQEPGSGNPTAVLQPIPWPHHVFQEPPQIFQHSPHLSSSEVDLDFQVQSPEEYQLQMMTHPSSFHLVAPEHEGNIVGDIMQSEQEEEFIDPVSIESEPLSEQQLYQDEENINDDRLLIEKTRDLMIQTTPQGSPHHLQDNEDFSVNDDRNKIVPNSCDVMSSKNSTVTETLESVAFVPKVLENKPIVKSKELPPSAWGPVPTLPSSATVKKQTTSVSVSAIPNKDVVPSAEQNDVITKHPTELKLHSDKDHQQIQTNSTSFSSITAAKKPLPSPTIKVDVKKTENKKQEVQQPLQKQDPPAMSDENKQKLVSTIIRKDAPSQELSKKAESTSSRTTQSSTEDISDEKPEQVLKPPPPANAPPAFSWANLFAPAEGSAAPKVSQKTHTQVANHQRNTETQTATAKNPEPLNVQPSPQVPAGMSYSAVSAQSVPASSASVTSMQQSPAVSTVTTKLPQSKMNLPNNNDNQVKPAPVDQHALRLGDFFSKYKIESNSVSLLPRGLLNKSNYCYINAILQALVACPPFYHLMKSIPPIPASYKSHTKTPVTDAMVGLVSNYSPLQYRKWAPREKGKKEDTPEIATDAAFEPTVILKMLQALRTEFFPVEGRQEDAEEFLSFIFNRMNDEMIELKKLVEKPKVLPAKEENGDEVNGETAPPGDDDDEWQVISGTRNKSTITRNMDFGRSPISDIFRGKSRLRIHREGDHSSDTIEPFFTLKLNIDKAPSVNVALENLCARDSLEGVTCSRTNQEVTAWQQVTLEELPVVLILHLKCFDYKKETATKILKTVEFPVELKLDQKIIASKKYQPRQRQYKLFAVVYHDGKEASKGHYITDVFHVGYSSWIRYDDSTVKAVSEQNVLHPKSPRVPYLLYYRRYDTIGGGNRERDHCNNLQTNQKSTK